MSSRFTSVEARIDAAARELLDRLPSHGLSGAAVEFLVFGLKQAWACLFGGAMLALIIATKYLWSEDMPLTRYDFLFLAALSIQLLMLAARLETPSEAKVILIFHIVGTAMEIFKTSAGSWIYPEDSFSASRPCRCSRASCTPRSAPIWRASAASSTCATRAIHRSGRRWFWPWRFM